ncbi:hypothetical protein CEXT_163431 [Caerostris extrusa]|uniref:Uncharacterized protein n=1 Tax=Caerostris extrusa TaxID=172846 RepID=A0AAV4V2Z4_CAEEX|nr:hypothetical protein CEXT_163431 [Caerostris extrusa]
MTVERQKARAKRNNFVANGFIVNIFDTGKGEHLSGEDLLIADAFFPSLLFERTFRLPREPQINDGAVTIVTGKPPGENDLYGIVPCVQRADTLH